MTNTPECNTTTAMVATGGLEDPRGFLSRRDRSAGETVGQIYFIGCDG